METKIDILIKEIQMSNALMNSVASDIKDMAQDTKDMKSFMHVLTNKLGGMI